MSIKSINEPDGPGRTTMVTPVSINEPPTGENLPDEVPTPVISSLDPAGCEISDPEFRLYVFGSGFLPSSVIHFAGQHEPTTLEEDGSLSTGVKPQLWQSAVVVQCQIYNGDKASNAVDFEFAAAGEEVADQGATRHHRGRTTHTVPSKRKS